MSSERDELSAEVRSLLRYHGSIGISYPKNENIERFLRFLPQVTDTLPSMEEKVVGDVPASPRKGNVPIHRSPVRITEIAAEVATCHACELHKKRIYPVAGRGPEKIRLLIVGDWLAADEGEVLPPGHLFGVFQDQMLSRMLTAINLSADEVFITNVIKCAIPQNCQPQAAHVQSCVSFLRRQIVSLLPEIICTMGMVATRAVLEKSQPLSLLRGQFHEYQVEKNRMIPVVATYHPTYLLQNPEMKQAAWADLQLLAKKMGLRRRS